MKTVKFKLWGIRYGVVVLLSAMLACQSDTLDEIPAVTVKPLTDKKVIAEIKAMASGNYADENGRTFSAPPTLPSGYNYNNMQQVNISGANWTTYVAFSTTYNSPSFKKMIGLYYDSNGVFRNFMYVEWDYESSGPPYSYTAPYSYKYVVPASYPTYFTKWKVDPDTGSVTNVGRLRDPAECGQYVTSCIDYFYTKKGWWSVGLTLATMVQPEVGVGVVGGCMLSCALGY